MTERPTVPGLTIDRDQAWDLDDPLWAVAEERGIWGLSTHSFRRGMATDLR